MNSSARMTSLGIPKDWEHFKVDVLDKYFSDSIKTQKETELQLLIQGSMIMSKFVAKLENIPDY